MAWNEHKINNWNNFIQIVDDLHLDEQGGLDWYFRGQSDKEWRLEPSILRYLRITKLTSERALGIEFGATRRFISEYHLHAKTDYVDRSKWDILAWWMVMQHHSCPTRVLDWTLSPYIALYFAVEQAPDKDGAVWFFPSNHLETHVEKMYGKIDKEMLTEANYVSATYPIMPSIHNERSAAQQSVFTVCTNILGEHSETIASVFNKDQKDAYLHKVIVPAELKNSFLSRLRVMNITPSSLFPGLDGLGHSAKDYIKLRVWRTDEQYKNKNI
jgi:hypothetical protein